MARTVQEKLTREFTCRKCGTTPGAERLRAAHTCSLAGSCPGATSETVLYAGTGCPAYDRNQPRLLVRDAIVPMRGPCPDSIGSVHLAYAGRSLLPSVSTDDP